MKEESRIVEETRQKIASGELTYDQMKEKLIAAINKEYEKEEEPDVELINACEELLAEMATDGQPLPESHEKQYGEVIRQNIRVSHPARNRGKIAKRLAVSLIVLVLLLGGGQVFLHREWFEHSTTDDEQQHTVQGFVVDPSLVAKCIAEEGDASALFFSENYDEVKNYLNFDLPSNIFLQGWDIKSFFIEIQSAYVKCSILYNCQNGTDTVFVQLTMFSDVNNAFVMFEQDQNGEEKSIHDIQTYHSHDNDYNSITWLDKNCIWCCYGYLTDKQIIETTEQIIQGGKNNE